MGLSLSSDQPVTKDWLAGQIVDMPELGPIQRASLVIMVNALTADQVALIGQLLAEGLTKYKNDGVGGVREYLHGLEEKFGQTAPPGVIDFIVERLTDGQDQTDRD